MMFKRRIGSLLTGLALLIFLAASLGYALTPAQEESAQTADSAAQSLALLPQSRADLESLTDLTHYTIDLNVDLDNASLKGEATVDYTNSEDVDLDRLFFRLFPNGGQSYGNGALIVARVTIDGDEVQATLSLDDTVLEIELMDTIAPGGKIGIKFEFDGTVPTDGSGYGIYCLQDEVMTLSGWYPILAVYDNEGWNLDPISTVGDSVYSDTALYTVSVTASRDLKVVGTGLRLSTLPTGESEVCSQFATGPVRDFILVLGSNFGQASRTVDGTTINAFYLPGREALAEAALDVAVDSLHAFNDAFGPYPYTELDIVDVPMNGPAGVEYPSIILVSSDLFGLEIVTVHEIAHQWWYGVVGNDVIDEPWLDEALASYSEAVYFENAKGEAAAQQHLENVRAGYEQVASAGGDDLVTAGLAHFEGKGALFGSIVYAKGALFFDAVRQAIGDEAFFAALRTYYENLRYEIATPADLLSAFEIAANQELDDLYDKWLYSKTAAKYDNIDDGLFVQLSTVFELFRTSADQIWTNAFRFDEDPMLFVRTNSAGDAVYGYLINHPNAEAVDGAQLVVLDDELALPPVYRLDAESLPHPAALATIPNFSFDYPVSGTDVFLLKYSEPGVNPLSAPTTFGWSKFVAHENFHRHQMGWQRPSAASQDIANYPLEADSIAFIFLETHLLIDALSADSDAARDTALNQFLAVRSSRMQQWEPARTMDNNQERTEGTARYIEYQLDAVAGQETEGLSLEENLDMILLAEPGRVRDTLAFGRFYATGAALCTLMDELALDWKPSIEAGQTPYDILAAYYGAEGQQALMQQAMAAHDFGALLGEASQLAGSATSESGAMGMPSGGMKIESIQKPYEVAPDYLVPFYMPVGYELLGSFQYEASEIEFPPLKSMYTPQGSTVTVLDLVGPDGDLRISRSGFVGGSIDEWRAGSAVGISDVQQTEVNSVPVLTSPWLVVCIFDDELILFEGDIPSEEILKIIASIVAD